MTIQPEKWSTTAELNCVPAAPNGVCCRNTCDGYILTKWEQRRRLNPLSDLMRIMSYHILYSAKMMLGRESNALSLAYEARGIPNLPA